MTDIRTRLVAGPVEAGALCDGIARCWLDVSNAGGAVGFPFLPVSMDQVHVALARLIDEVNAGSVLLFIAESNSAAEGNSVAESNSAAEQEGEVRGWVLLRLNRSKLTQHWGYVERLQSHPDSRGSGIGKLLMATLVEHARSLGLEQLHLVLRGGENLEPFYEQLGWVEIGRHSGALRLSDGGRDDDRDEVSMLLRLDRR